MKQYVFNGEKLTEETILKTRKWYHDNAIACVKAVESGWDKVAHKEDYLKWQCESAERYMKGENDHILAFLQRAYYIQTGKSIALLP